MVDYGVWLSSHLNMKKSIISCGICARESQHHVWESIFLVWMKYLPSTRYRRVLLENNFKVSLMFVSRIFKKWRWSFKKPSYEQLNKYTQENILYYATYQHCIKEIPWYRLKFADESHFNSKGICSICFKLINARFEKRQGPISKEFLISDPKCSPNR